MGQYLSIGICNELRVSKSAVEKATTNKNRLEFSCSDFDIDLYSLQEKEEIYLWSLKDDILKAEAYNFLSAFFSDYGNKDTAKYILEKIRSCNSGKEIINLAKEDAHECFQYCIYTEDNIYIQVNNEKWVRADTEYIMLCLEGKIMMECWGEIFGFLTNILQKNYSHFRLAKALNIFITG